MTLSTSPSEFLATHRYPPTSASVSRRTVSAMRLSKELTTVFTTSYLLDDITISSVEGDESSTIYSYYIGQGMICIYRIQETDVRLKNYIKKSFISNKIHQQYSQTLKKVHDTWFMSLFDSILYYNIYYKDFIRYQNSKVCK